MIGPDRRPATESNADYDLRELAWRPLLEGCHSYVHLRMGPRRAIPAMVNLRTESNANHCEYHKYNNALTVSFLLHMRRKFVRHRCSLPTKDLLIIVVDCPTGEPPIVVHGNADTRQSS
jgi:hypothetical protein